MGLPNLPPPPSPNIDGMFARCETFLVSSNTDLALSVVELTFRMIENLSRASTATEFKENYGGQSASDAIVELNGRFKEHDLGYEYNAGVIQRVDSQYLHAEVVEPALNLLYESGFQGPSEEFLSAHKHHREGSTKEGIREALNAFESTLKAICDARQWSYPKGAGANKLVDTVFIHGLIAPELRSHFDVLDKTLSAGLPVVRNEMGGHGQGAEVAEVPGYMAAYALHLAATNIVMLVEANKDFQSGS